MKVTHRKSVRSGNDRVGARDDNEFWDGADSSSGEDFEAGFADGTSAAIRRFAAHVVVDDGSTATKSRKLSVLRLRKAPGVPSGIDNSAVVHSADYYNQKGLCDDVSSSDEKDEDEDVDEAIGSDNDDDDNNDDDSDGNNSDSDDDTDDGKYLSDEALDSQSDQEGEGCNKLKLPSLLLEAQWKLEEQAKRELQLIQKRDEIEQQQLRIKALHSKNQASLWNSLIAIRIHLQKVLTDASRLPLPPAAQMIRQQIRKHKAAENKAEGCSDSSTLLRQSSQSVARLLLSLRRLQTSLIRNNKQTTTAIFDGSSSSSQQSLPVPDGYYGAADFENLPLIESRKRRRQEFESSTIGWVQKESSVWRQFDHRPMKVIRWACSVADQWSAKTTIKVQQSFKVLNQNPSAQVSRALRVDFEKLLHKTRPTICRGSGAAPVLGMGLLDLSLNGGSGVNAEAYDDMEFYVSLLKDSVRQNTTDSEMVSAASQVNALSSRLKKQEAENKKKDVDRQTRNGRRIRYTPIPQLLSFMTAEPMKCGNPGLDGETDDRFVNQLIASLFQDVQL